MRELKLTYLEKVQQETTKFLNTRIKHDFLKPDRELTLDLLVKEAEVLMAANSEVRQLADSGELRQIHDRYNAAKNRVETEYLAFREHLAKTLQVVEGKENEIYTQLQSLGFNNVKFQGEAGGVLDILGLSSGDSLFDNIAIVEGAIDNNHESSAQLSQIRDQLHAFVGVKAKIFAIDAKLKENFINYVAKNEEDVNYTREEFNALDASRQAYEQNFARREVGDSAKAEYDAFVGSLNEFHSTHGNDLIKDFQDYERSYNDRQSVYADYARGNTDEAMVSFRTDLLQHLAGSIVVKEHRQRYQKEQFDRFISSLQYNALYGKNQSLREFCRQYANMIEVLIEDSHNDRSPKIEANYDDFGEQTVRPLNATIFYYFFSADRSKRTIAQWFLAAARYPNERVRRAYMHFFA